ncbi:hypothetical protein ACSSS7_008441 [Eimeria intestinalis]
MAADLGGARLNALGGHDVGQVRDGGGAEAAFAGVERKVRVAEALEEGFVLAVVPPGVAVDDDVLDVADRRDPLHATQEHIGHTREGSGTGAQARGTRRVSDHANGDTPGARTGISEPLRIELGDRFPALVTHGGGERRGGEDSGDIRRVHSRCRSAVVEAVRVLCEELAERLQLIVGQAAVGQGLGGNLPQSFVTAGGRQAASGGVLGGAHSARLAGDAGDGAAGM